MMQMDPFVGGFAIEMRVFKHVKLVMMLFVMAFPVLILKIYLAKMAETSRKLENF